MVVRKGVTAFAVAALLGLGVGGATGVSAQDGQMVVITNDGVSQSSNAAGASNVVPVRADRVDKAQKEDKVRKDRTRPAKDNSEAAPVDDWAPAADAAPLEDYSGAPVDTGVVEEVAPAPAAPVQESAPVVAPVQAAPVALPNTGTGQGQGGLAVGLGTLAALAAAAAVAARRIRIAG